MESYSSKKNLIYEDWKKKEYSTLCAPKIINNKNKNSSKISSLNKFKEQKKTQKILIKDKKKLVSEHEQEIAKLKEKIEEERNAILQIQFEALECKQSLFDFKENFGWKIGIKIEKFFKKIGIYYLLTLLKKADFKRSGILITTLKTLNELLCVKRRKQAQTFEKQNEFTNKKNNKYKTKLKLSVVVCTYQRREKLIECVWSVLRQSFGKKDYEIIIIDNSPEEENVSLDILYFKNKYKKLRGFIRYFREKQSGLSHARNKGISVARGEVLLFLDDDVIADYHLLEEMFVSFKNHEKAGVIGGQIILDLPFPKPSIVKKNWEYLWSELKVQYNTYKSVSKPFELPFGANFATRTSVAKAVGGFETNYGRTGNNFQGGEELIFALKAKKIGYDIAIEPKAKVLHRVEAARFNKKHIRKTITSGIVTSYQISEDGYFDAIWTKTYVKNQISITKREIKRFIKRKYDKTDIFYKKSTLIAWIKLLRIINSKRQEKNLLQLITKKETSG